MKIHKVFAYIILNFIMLMLLLILFAYISTRNKTSGTITVPHITGKVIIVRDQYGIPHIQALKNDQDAFFALGYVHAQDRFWQMEFQRRVAEGTLSEVFGKTTIHQDKFLRTWGFYRAAKAAWPALSPQTKAIVESYTEGINTFLQYGNLPIQFKILHYQPQPWTVIDTIAWQKMMAFDLQDVWKRKIINFEIMQQLGKNQIPVLLPPYPKDAPTILSNYDLVEGNAKSMYTISKNTSTSNDIFFQQLALQFEQVYSSSNEIRDQLGFGDAPGKGSNDWVVTSRLSSTGKPFLLNDPHLSISAPNLWYLAELRGPHLHVIGATIPGYPGIIIGHNDFIAWGMTNINPDTQDLYIEPNNIPLHVIHEIIKVRGNSSIDWPVKFSVHGPIISNVSDVGNINHLIALKWTALLPNDTTTDSFLEINYAHNWQEFTNALQHFLVPSQNFVYADINGNIGYYAPGLIPIRHGWNGEFPVMPGERAEWNGYIPFSKLPHVFNPTENYIASANNKITPDGYEYPITFRWSEAPYRIERIIDLINKFAPITIQKSELMQTDVNNYFWRDIRSILLKTKPLDIDSQNALKVLQNWDGNTSINSIGASIFAVWLKELAKMPTHDFPLVHTWYEPLFIKQQLLSNSSYCRSQYNNCNTYLSYTLQRAVEELISKNGNNINKWKWSSYHHAEFKELGLGNIWLINLLWNHTIPTPGSYYTVNSGTYDDKDFDQIKAAGYRQIIDLSNFNHSLFIQMLGQSDDPFSHHQDDMMKLWRDGKYISMSSNPKDWGIYQQLILQPQ